MLESLSVQQKKSQDGMQSLLSRDAGSTYKQALIVLFLPCPRYFNPRGGHTVESLYQWWHSKLANYFERVANIERKAEVCSRGDMEQFGGLGGERSSEVKW